MKKGVGSMFLKQVKQKEIPLEVVHTEELMEENKNAMRHLGFLPLSSIYHELKINQFLINRQRSRAMDYSLNDDMQLLVYTRILSPGSKLASFRQKENFATSFNCD